MEQMTVKKALEITIANLEQIKVPMAQMQDIGFPLMQNIGNLREILTAIERAEQSAQETKETQEVKEDGEN